MKQFNTILSLRRDNDYNYAKIKDKFIPENGEICLVDTADSGLRVICGDGISTFGQLNYIDTILYKGYLIDNQFYQDIEKTTPIVSLLNKIYIDIPTGGIYYYDGVDFCTTAAGLPTASAQKPGIMKLYSTMGSNEDGTMTQKAITDELNEKVEVALNIDEELLIFVNE